MPRTNRRRVARKRKLEMQIRTLKQKWERHGERIVQTNRIICEELNELGTKAITSKHDMEAGEIHSMNQKLVELERQATNLFREQEIYLRLGRVRPELNEICNQIKIWTPLINHAIRKWNHYSQIYNEQFTAVFRPTKIKTTKE